MIKCPVVDAVELDRAICREATGGPGGRTKVISAGNAKEKRNKTWPVLRKTWQVMWVAKSSEDKFKDLLNFFYSRVGMAYGFLFYDWTDHDDWGNGVVLLDSDSGKYQLFKIYSDDVRPLTKPIFKPVLDTVVIYSTVDDVTTVVTDPPIDYTTGQIDWAAEDVPDGDITWTGDFLLPVRFNQDDMTFKVDPSETVVWNGISLIELI